MKKTDKIFLCDMDGTLCDYEGAMRRDLQNLAQPDDEPVDYASCSLWDIEETYPWLEARMSKIKSSAEWWANLPVIESGMLIYRLAVEIGFEPCIFTKGPLSHTIAWGSKVDWVHRYLGRKTRVHVVTEKDITYGRVLFDDYKDYMEMWLGHRPRGLGIMPLTPENKGFEHPQVLKWDGTNLETIRQALVVAYNRQPLETVEWH